MNRIKVTYVCAMAVIFISGICLSGCGNGMYCGVLFESAIGAYLFSALSFICFTIVEKNNPLSMFADGKKIEQRKHNILNLLAKAAVVVVFVGAVSFAAVKIDANIFGFTAWKTIESDKNLDGNVEIDYSKNKKTKENGADKVKERKNDFPEYIPEGFKLDEQNDDNDFRYAEWTNDKKYLVYSSEKILKDAKYYGKNADGKKVSVAGYVGYLYEEKGERTLQWNDDKYINTIGTDDDMVDSELFKIAESLY